MRRTSVSVLVFFFPPAFFPITWVTYLLHSSSFIQNHVGRRSHLQGTAEQPLPPPPLLPPNLSLPPGDFQRSFDTPTALSTNQIGSNQALK
ncbi:hypothetical protein F4778DRAFT_743953 [Xylariomycetidae sp. FL2044]|nr:hypothetical protein F4778DRAFT_743953 [Xylariomycetidae sp. FL2044]